MEETLDPAILRALIDVLARLRGPVFFARSDDSPLSAQLRSHLEWLKSVVCLDRSSFRFEHAEEFSRKYPVGASSVSTLPHVTHNGDGAIDLLFGALFDADRGRCSSWLGRERATIVFYAPSGTGKTYQLLKYGCIADTYLTYLTFTRDTDRLCDSSVRALMSTWKRSLPSLSPAARTPKIRSDVETLLEGRLLFLLALHIAFGRKIRPDEYLVSQLFPVNASRRPEVQVDAARFADMYRGLVEAGGSLSVSDSLFRTLGSLGYPENSLSVALDELNVLFGSGPNSLNYECCGEALNGFVKNGHSRGEPRAPFLADPVLRTVARFFRWRHLLLSGTAMQHDWWSAADSPARMPGCQTVRISAKHHYRVIESFEDAEAFLQDYLRFDSDFWPAVAQAWKELDGPETRSLFQSGDRFVGSRPEGRRTRLTRPRLIPFDDRHKALGLASRRLRFFADVVRQFIEPPSTLSPAIRFLKCVGRVYRTYLKNLVRALKEACRVGDVPGDVREHRTRLRGLVGLLHMSCRHATLPRVITLDSGKYDLLPTSLAFPACPTSDTGVQHWELGGTLVDDLLSHDWVTEWRLGTGFFDDPMMTFLIQRYSGNPSAAGFTAEGILCEKLCEKWFRRPISELLAGLKLRCDPDETEIMQEDREVLWPFPKSTLQSVESLKNCIVPANRGRLLSPNPDSGADAMGVSGEPSFGELVALMGMKVYSDLSADEALKNLKSTSLLTQFHPKDIEFTSDGVCLPAGGALSMEHLSAVGSVLLQMKYLLRFVFDVEARSRSRDYSREKCLFVRDLVARVNELKGTDLRPRDDLREYVIFVTRENLPHLLGTDGVLFGLAAWSLILKERRLALSSTGLRVASESFFGGLPGETRPANDFRGVVARVAAFRDFKIGVKFGGGATVPPQMREIHSFSAIQTCGWPQSPVVVDLSPLQLHLPASEPNDELSDAFNRALLGLDSEQEKAIADDQLVDFYVLFRELRLVDYCYVLCRKAASFEGDDLAKLKSRAAFDLNLSRDLAIVTALSPGPKNLENHPEFAALARPLPTTFAAAARRLYVKARNDGGTNVTLTTADAGEELAHIEWLVVRTKFFRKMMESNLSEADEFRQTGKIALEFFSHAELKALLECVYTGAIGGEGDFRQLVQLLLHASQFEEEELSDAVFRRVSVLLKDLEAGEVSRLLLETMHLVRQLAEGDRNLLFDRLPRLRGLESDRSFLSFRPLSEGLSEQQQQPRREEEEKD